MNDQLSLLDEQKSERFIAREKQKRQNEERIAEQLAVRHRSEIKDGASESTFANLGFHVREAKPVGLRGWSCPSKGDCSVLR